MTDWLAAGGFDEDQTGKLSTSWGDRAERRARPTFRLTAPAVGGPVLRGVHGSALVAFTDGTASLALAAPAPLDTPTGHGTRLILRGLPLALPLNDPVARLVHPHAEARDGLLIHIANVASTWNLDITQPTPDETLSAWAAGHGQAARRPAKPPHRPSSDRGPYAAAAIGRAPKRPAADRCPGLRACRGRLRGGGLQRRSRH